MSGETSSETIQNGGTQSGGVAIVKRTALYDCHLALSAKMVPFAGYEMPVQYRLGVLKEHLWTRKKAGLFDVSHMGLAHLKASNGRHETVARALEALVPADILNLAPGRQRYTQLLNDDGGIIDDLMVARSADPAHDGWLYLVVNASRKGVDYQHIASALLDDVELLPSDDFVLMALQGPQAIDVIAGHDASARDMRFMSARFLMINGVSVHATRSGYTGEDGFELSVPRADAVAIWSTLVGDDRVEPIGLGARDSLRLEAGLCLYGHDIDETTSPVEAGLTWSIQKRRRTEGGFPGAARVQAELANGPKRRRVGIKPDGRAPAREGAEVRLPGGAAIGVVTSGGFSPTTSGPVAMGYVAAEHVSSGTSIELIVRGKEMPATIVDMPFVPHGYAR